MLRTTQQLAIQLKIASPDDILSFSRGEVMKPETINYRTQRPDPDGLFSERIFGPSKNLECGCGKLKGEKYLGLTCDRCKVTVGYSWMRRERMGHITLAAPVAHIWYLRKQPSKVALLLDVPVMQLEKVAYFSAYIVTSVSDKAKAELRQKIESDYKSKLARLSAEDQQVKLKRLYQENLKELEGIVPKQVLSDVEYFQYSKKYPNCFTVGIGAEPIREFLVRIDLKDMHRRIIAELKTARKEKRTKLLVKLKIVTSFLRNGFRPEWLILSVLPVLPADLRPLVPLENGMFASSDLNDLYRRVINRNNRLKRLTELKAPEIIIRNEKRMLQEAVDALFDNGMRRAPAAKVNTGTRRTLKSLADMLSGKRGRFRLNLLGKRVDYSGRAVITPGPNLKLSECGVPKVMALELFQPFIIKELLDRGIAQNIKHARHLISLKSEEVWPILDSVIKDKYVLLNRAPTLHRLGILAFRPVLIEGVALQIHPFVCKGFNADFDGDAMAIHLPLSDEAQKEASEMMLATKNILKPATGEPIAIPSLDFNLGCYWLTTIDENGKGTGMTLADENDALLMYDHGVVDLRAKIRVLQLRGGESAETTVGRIVFNAVLPKEIPFVNADVSGGALKDLVVRCYTEIGLERTTILLDEIKTLGLTYATRSGISIGMDDIALLPEKDQLLEGAKKQEERIDDSFEKGLLSREEKKELLVELWKETANKMNAAFKKHVPKGNPFRIMIEAKTKGDWPNLYQMGAMKGLVVNPQGEVIDFPIISSYKEGLTVLEYFISSHGARKGTVDTAIKTPKAGYLARRLVDCAQDVIVKEIDCKATKGVTITQKESEDMGDKLSFRIYSRAPLEDIKTKKGDVIVKKGQYITKELAKAVEEAGVAEVKVRSPLTCRAMEGICQKCYGLDLGLNQPAKLGDAVGVIAAQSISEPGTQLTLRTFHAGGSAAAADITQGLPRVEEIFEARDPKGEGVISDASGAIAEIERKPKYFRIIVSEQKKKTILHVPLTQTLLVKKGETIQKGMQISEGPLAPKKVFKYFGKDPAMQYLVSEVKKVYNSQGAPIHDKHIEVIVRQMFSRVRIKEANGSEFVPGEITERSVFLRTNRELKRSGKKPATAVQILLGIKRVSLTSDSFLSAASFEETGRILVKAATEGKVDRLRGLKENVILGRLVPAGTGFRE